MSAVYTFDTDLADPGIRWGGRLLTFAEMTALARNGGCVDQDGRVLSAVEVMLGLGRRPLLRVLLAEAMADSGTLKTSYEWVELP